MTRKKIKKGNIRKKNRIISRLNRKNPRVKRRNTKKGRNKKNLRGGAGPVIGNKTKVLSRMGEAFRRQGSGQIQGSGKMYLPESIFGFLPPAPVLDPNVMRVLIDEISNEFKDIFHSWGTTSSLKEQSEGRVALKYLAKCLEKSIKEKNMKKLFRQFVFCSTEYIDSNLEAVFRFWFDEKYKNLDFDFYWYEFISNLDERNAINSVSIFNSIGLNVKLNLISSILCVYLQKEILASSPNCKGKNHYNDIIPFSRNVLTTDGRQLNTDCSNYLNASKIDIQRIYQELNQRSEFNLKADKYVAAQGPFVSLHPKGNPTDQAKADSIPLEQIRQDTRRDFWNAIKANGINLVVQVAEPYELPEGIYKYKCDNYLEGGGKYGLTLMNGKVFNNPKIKTTGDSTNITYGDSFTGGGSYSLRIFIYNDKMIFHVKYNNWPDRGTPDMGMFAKFINFIYQLQKYNPLSAQDIIDNASLTPVNTKEPKTLVHCSAGIGRTGLTILALLKEELKEQLNSIKLNGRLILEIIICLKMQRLNLIQTESQLNFAWKYMKS